MQNLYRYLEPFSVNHKCDGRRDRRTTRR